jgi:hypothetical protein
VCVCVCVCVKERELKHVYICAIWVPTLKSTLYHDSRDLTVALASLSSGLVHSKWTHDNVC